MNRKPPFVPLAPTALLSMPLALFACSDRSEQKAPSSPSAATVFKDSPEPEPLPASPGTATAQQGSPPPANNARTPDQLFFSMGCKACHGPGSAYSAMLVNSRTKPAEDIARFILHPEQVRPGTMMPGYAHRMSQEDALALARWLKAGNPAPSE